MYDQNFFHKISNFKVLTVINMILMNIVYFLTYDYSFKLWDETGNISERKSTLIIFIQKIKTTILLL